MERLPTKSLHHEVQAPGQLTETKNIDDVRMIDLVDDACLVDKAPNEQGARAPSLGQDLDRNCLCDQRMNRRVDSADASLSDLALDSILADHRSGREFDSAGR